MSVPTANRLSPVRFVVGFGTVSALADVVYEGARSIIGPYLGTLGASAATVGVLTGLGEAIALVLRVFTGRISDRTGRPWPQTVVGYLLTAVCVPALALTHTLAAAGAVYSGERLGKAVRTPARDTMLAHASAKIGRGRAFGLHEALDQTGALIGPLVIAGVLALHAGYHVAFGVLAVPGAAAVLVLLRMRAAAPHPADYDPQAGLPEAKRLRLEGQLPVAFWQYAAFSAATMLGFSTWGVLAYHLSVRHVVSPSVVPVLYAGAMGVAALAALGFGRIYDRHGLRGLTVLPVLGAVVPLLAFTTSLPAVIVGALLWGAGMGVHDSTMRAAVAEFVPVHRRGAGYGTFTAIYGLAWLAGATIIGHLYGSGRGAIAVYVVAVQMVALVLLVPLLGGRSR